MSKYRCVFRNCNTTNSPGKGEMPSSCAAKGCPGTFEKRPVCRTFINDLSPPEPIMQKPDWGMIRVSREMPLKRPGSMLLLGCWKHPAHAVAQA